MSELIATNELTKRFNGLTAVNRVDFRVNEGQTSGIIGPNANLSPMYDRMVKRVAMQKEGQPEDIANAIAFLCSERARYITGAVLTVTGGMDLFTF